MWLWNDIWAETSDKRLEILSRYYPIIIIISHNILKCNTIIFWRMYLPIDRKNDLRKSWKSHECVNFWSLKNFVASKITKEQYYKLLSTRMKHRNNFDKNISQIVDIKIYNPVARGGISLNFWSPSTIFEMNVQENNVHSVEEPWILLLNLSASQTTECKTNSCSTTNSWLHKHTALDKANRQKCMRKSRIETRSGSGTKRAWNGWRRKFESVGSSNKRQY